MNCSLCGGLLQVDIGPVDHFGGAVVTLSCHGARLQSRWDPRDRTIDEVLNLLERNMNRQAHEHLAAPRVALVDEFDAWRVRLREMPRYQLPDSGGMATFSLDNWTGRIPVFMQQERLTRGTTRPLDFLNAELARQQEVVRTQRDRALVLQRAAEGRIGKDDIVAEVNLEVRRAMLEVYGLERFLADVGARVVAADGYGELLRWTSGPISDPISPTSRHLTIQAVRVLNSTPEPDGSVKTYVLRVPADVRTPREGIAWTFGLREEEYNPEVMT